MNTVPKRECHGLYLATCGASNLANLLYSLKLLFDSLVFLEISTIEIPPSKSGFKPKLFISRFKFFN